MHQMLQQMTGGLTLLLGAAILAGWALDVPVQRSVLFVGTFITLALFLAVMGFLNPAGDVRLRDPHRMNNR
jgi:hypothetical protein